jgi:vitamin B12 transporter
MGEDMTRLQTLKLGAATAAVALAANAAFAQDAPLEIDVAQAATELPAVTVEGATLAKPTARKPQSDAPARPSAATSAPPPRAASAAAQPEPGPSTSFEAPTGEPSRAGGAADAPLSADKVGASVSVVTRAEIEGRQLRTVADALRGLPGISVSQQGGAGNLSVVRIRGAESNHTLVVIDGVEANSTVDGLFDFSTLDAEDIEQIEVLRGPQSGIYGASALGGVINIVTSGGKGPLRARGRVEGGSFGTTDVAAAASGGDDRAHGSFSVHRRETDGFNIAPVGSEDDGSELTTIAFNGGVAVFDILKITGGYRQSHLEGDRDGLNNFDAQGFNVTSDELSTLSAINRLGHVAATLDTLGGDWVHTLRATYRNSDVEDVDRGFGASFSELLDERWTYGYTTTYRLESGPNVRHFFTGLVEQAEEKFEQPTAGNFTADRDRLSTAGEIRGQYFNSLYLAASVRHDDNSTFDDYTSWRAQGAFKFPDTPFRLHSSVGTGVKYPSFAELFGTFFRFTPNPDLQPETSFGWDAGVETTLLRGRAVVDVTYFDQTLEDEITEDFSQFPLITAINLDGESKRRGVEISGRYLITDALSVGATYTYLDSVDPDGREEVRRAPHSGRADVSYSFLDGKGLFTLAAIYNGSMLDVAFNLFDPTIDRIALDEYWLVTAAASYKIADGVELYGRVDNLLDEDYQEIFGYETAGAAAYAGVKFNYEHRPVSTWGGVK